MFTQKLLKRRVIASAVALGVTAALGACSSSTNNNPAVPEDTAAKSPATGPEVDVWTIAATGGVTAAPQPGAGVKAAARYMNDHGGIGPNHQKVVVKACDTQFTPQGEIQCAQQAADDPQAIAAVAPQDVLAVQQFTTVLQNAGLPSVGGIPVAPSDFTNTINFPLVTTNFGAAACAVLTAHAVKANTVGFATVDIPAAVDVTNDGVGAAKHAGLNATGPVTFPVTTTDVTPFVSQVSEKGADAVVLAAASQGTGAWLAAAARLGKSKPTCVIDGTVPNQVLGGLGEQAKDFYAASFLPDASWTGYPMLDKFRQQAQAEVSEDKAASLDASNNTELVMLGWAAMQAVQQGAANVSGALTRSDFLAALNNTTVKIGEGSTALLPPVDFSKPNSNPKYTRLFNTKYFLKKWDVTKQAFVQVQGADTLHADELVP
ncbi:ABC transporter substrate-binding protein [Nocardia sp. NPDC059239]|uniref:ABC transporter substrate-binding protein n=1 Tax=unclassified Nocardia TaxID=2637762 RepID=UPI0036BC10A8